MTTATAVTTYEANDQTTGHAEALFRAWKQELPAYKWTSAHLGRNHGLVICTEGDLIALHFKTPGCGYSGSGSHCAATILEEAGFGKYEDLLKQIEANSICIFERSGDD